jgi:hypothetical protein
MDYFSISICAPAPSGGIIICVRRHGSFCAHAGGAHSVFNYPLLKIYCGFSPRISLQTQALQNVLDKSL